MKTATSISPAIKPYGGASGGTAAHPPATNETFEQARQGLLRILDERQRRLFAGMESLRPGNGGDRLVADRLGMARATVTKGRKQLLSGDYERHRIRKPGGGRKRAEKKRPDPDSLGAHHGRRHGGGSLQRTAMDASYHAGGRLGAAGKRHYRRTVCRILNALGYALRVNHKKLAGASHPDRNRQFDRIAELRARALNMRQPLVSVDTKKKELIGCFRNAGACWRRDPKLVNDHDFRSQAEGRAIPYGLYDLQANTGAFYVGLSRRSSP